MVRYSCCSHCSLGRTLAALHGAGQHRRTAWHGMPPSLSSEGLLACLFVCLSVCLLVFHLTAKLIVAHARGDKDEVVRLHFARAEQGGMGTVTKRMNSEVASCSSSGVVCLATASRSTLRALGRSDIFSHHSTMTVTPTT